MNFKMHDLFSFTQDAFNSCLLNCLLFVLVKNTPVWYMHESKLKPAWQSVETVPHLLHQLGAITNKDHNFPLKCFELHCSHLYRLYT